MEHTVSSTLIRCPLCGNQFEEAEGAACTHCRRLFKTCGMVACPRCSHEFPRVKDRR